MRVTSIELPHKVLDLVGPILAEAGFELGTVGSGWGQMERVGEISEEEKATLTQKMAEELFTFDIDEYVEEDEEGN